MTKTTSTDPNQVDQKPAGSATRLFFDASPEFAVIEAYWDSIEITIYDGDARAHMDLDQQGARAMADLLTRFADDLERNRGGRRA